jgi:hypothetical protein
LFQLYDGDVQRRRRWVVLFLRAQHREELMSWVPPLGFIYWSGANKVFEWGWTDWVGVSAFLLIAAFVVFGVMAIRRGASPLRVLDKTANLVRAALRAHRD